MGDVKRVGIVTGLQLEADIARALPNACVLCYGPGPDKAKAAAKALIDQGVSGLISFGIAGGLDPNLKAGTILVPQSAWGASVVDASSADLRRAALITVSDPSLTPAAKAALFAQTGAQGVDMESSSIEVAAKSANIPYGFIRAICDEAGDTIPATALRGMASDGSIRPVRVAAGLLTRPQDLAALLHLGRQQKKAVAALNQFVETQQGSILQFAPY